MSDLIHDLRQAGLSEDDARKACRVVAEWLAVVPLTLRLQDLPRTDGGARRAIAACLREAGETPS